MTKKEAIKVLNDYDINFERHTAEEIAGVGVDCLGYRVKEYKCSNCGNIDLSHRKNKFCPECGKRMEG